MPNNRVNTACTELGQKKSMIWESARLKLATLREYMSDCMDRLGFFEEDPPDCEAWNEIKLSAEVAFQLLEGVTDLIDTVEGDPPPYMENLFECMNAANTSPAEVEISCEISPDIVDLIASLSIEQKNSLLKILKRQDVNPAYFRGMCDGVAIREGGAG